MIQSLSLLSSSACNLNCQFCFLNKNKSFNEYDKQILKAWKEKTYIKNVNQALLKMGENPNNIKFINFWGGETLLHITELTENLSELYKYFPNISQFLFPTNWSVNIKEFFNFIQEVDKYTLHKTYITVQLSVDGPEGEFTKQGHNIKFDTYKKNIKLFADLINNTKLNNIKIYFTIKATVFKELYFKYLDNYEGMKNYIQKMDELTNYMKNSFISESCDCIINHVFPGMALPAQETVEEGLKLAYINRLWEYININEFKNNTIFSNSKDSNFYFGLSHFNQKENCLSSNVSCDQLKSCFTFLPDGTIVECNSSYIATNVDYLNECLENNQLNEYYSNLIHKSNCFNPLHASLDDIKRYKWSVIDGIKGNEKTFRYFEKAICSELAYSGQIPKKYAYDTELLNSHLDIISGITTCTFENVNNTKNVFITNPSTFRRFLNGLTEYAYDNQKIEIIQQELKNNGNL